MSREIMQRSLATFKVLDEGGGLGYENHALIRRQIETLEEALAKPEQKPVAWISESPTKGNGKHLYFSYEQAWKWSSNITPLYTAAPRKECEIEQARREERGWCHQLVWDYGFSRVDNEDVQEACSILAKQILAGSKK